MIDSLISQGYPLTAKYYHGICGLASKLSYKYGKQNQEEDFVQVALATACKAESRYTSTSGASFYTYINKIIKGDIQKAFGNPNRKTKKYKQIQEFIDIFGKNNTRYPNVQEISKGTGLSRFDILSIYYDRYSEQNIDTSMDEGLMTNPFSNSDHSWIIEHLECLSAKEQSLIVSLFTDEMSINDAAGSNGLSTIEAIRIKNEALAKLKQSIQNYQ